jgi:hypothetical protein
VAYLPTFMFYIEFIIHGLSTSAYSDFFKPVYVQGNGERNFHSPNQGYSIWFKFINIFGASWVSYGFAN